MPDSSVWIAHLRGQDDATVRKLRVAMIDRLILVGDLVLLEVLQGARNHGHATRLEVDLCRFPVVGMIDATIAAKAARNFRDLRAHGITIRRTIDLIIGTFCIEGGHALLHRDRDFDPMARHLGLLIA